MKKHLKIGMIGSGSWATALVKIFLNNTNVNWYMVEEGAISYMKKHHHNPNYLSSVEFDVSEISFFDDINKLVEATDVIVFAIPSAYFKVAIEKITVDISKKLVVSAIKGILPDDNITPAEFLNKKYNVPFSNIGIIAGPCHAEEVALERLSYLTISSKNEKLSSFMLENIECRYIHARSSLDIYGTEYSAILKNIIAVVAGICNGLGYGDNFQAVLVSNAIQEIKRFLDKTYPTERQINSSAYLGDLLVTAYSQFSRNRTLGTMVGKGYSVKSAILEMNMVAEGYYAVKGIKEINKKYNVDMPITDAAYNILYEKISPAIEIKLLSEKLS